MNAEEISEMLDQMFPQGGRNEEIGPILSKCGPLTVAIKQAWSSLPEALKNRIQSIELEMRLRN